MLSRSWERGVTCLLIFLQYKNMAFCAVKLFNFHAVALCSRPVEPEYSSVIMWTCLFAFCLALLKNLYWLSRLTGLNLILDIG